MNYWLLKSEPFKYSWEDLLRDGRTSWDGVRNYQAANNMKSMKQKDKAFFYHSNEGLAIVGTVEIVRTAYPDPSDETGKFVMVDIKPLQAAKHPVTLAEIKDDPVLKDMVLVKQARLSVSPVTAAEWKRVCEKALIKEVK